MAHAAAPEMTAEQKAYVTKLAALPWIRGAKPVAVTDKAQLTLDQGYRFLDTKGASDLLTLNGNLPSTGTYALAPDNVGWFATFDFEDIGYVKDDEAIDAESLLSTIREQQAEGNKQRAEQGLEALTVKGWSVAPHYDRATHNLEYGLILGSPSGDSVNYRMRMLGRHGVMNATLITAPETLEADLAAFRSATKTLGFIKDEQYASYKQGDKVSEYGLAALVTGGAAAALAKGGLLKGLIAGLAAFWKLIAVGVIAFFASIRRIFARLLGRGEAL